MWNSFGNIRFSEQTHMEWITKTLIITHNPVDPVEKVETGSGVFVNPIMQNYYNELSMQVENFLTEALKSWSKLKSLI
ncbi:MAG: DUF2202 domain-containing protein [Chitinophagaceae bacterium]|nr:DUF2202 domain-containing protein [Chitinophagaceae bacterium]